MLMENNNTRFFLFAAFLSLMAICGLVPFDALAPTYATDRALDKKAREIHFPDSISLGKLYLLPAGLPIWNNEYLVLKNAPFRAAGKAQGSIRIPGNMSLFLDVGYAAVQDPSLLTAYGQDFFAGLKFERLEINDKPMAIVGTLTGLRALDVRDSNVSDAGLKSLSNLKNLEYLNLSRTAITGHGLPSLAGLRSLRTVLLDGNTVTDNGLKFIRQCDHVHLLALNHCQITDQGLRSLSTLTEVESLELNFNPGITATGLLQLTGLRNLKSLEVRTTAITAKDLPVIQALKRRTPSLQCISLSDKSFSKEAVKKWEQSLPGLKVAASEITLHNSVHINVEDAPWLFAPLRPGAGHKSKE
jgi:hypothetical protein